MSRERAFAPPRSTPSLSRCKRCGAKARSRLIQFLQPGRVLFGAVNRPSSTSNPTPAIDRLEPILEPDRITDQTFIGLHQVFEVLLLRRAFIDRFEFAEPQQARQFLGITRIILITRREQLIMS